MIVAIGSNDTLASPGTQLDFYQSMLDKSGTLESRQFCAPLRAPANRAFGLTGTNYTTLTATERNLRQKPIPNTFDRLALLTEWVEKGSSAR